MVFIGKATYKESTGKNIIDLVFATPLFIKSFITYGIAGDFDHDLDHQPILSKWTMRIVKNPLSSQLLLSKIDMTALKKTLAEELAKDPPCISTMPNK